MGWWLCILLNIDLYKKFIFVLVFGCHVCKFLNIQTPSNKCPKIKVNVIEVVGIFLYKNTDHRIHLYITTKEQIAKVLRFLTKCNKTKRKYKKHGQILN